MALLGAPPSFAPNTTIISDDVNAYHADIRAAVNTALFTDITQTVTIFQRMANDIWWKGRNAANSADISAWRINASNLLEVGVSIVPPSNDGAALGASGTAWADLFLASGAVLNFNAG